MPKNGRGRSDSADTVRASPNRGGYETSAENVGDRAVPERAARDNPTAIRDDNGRTAARNERVSVLRAFARACGFVVVVVVTLFPVRTAAASTHYTTNFREGTRDDDMFGTSFVAV